MAQSWHNLIKYSREFQRHWLQYCTLFIAVDLAVQLLAIPFFRFVTTFVLQAGEVPFVSYMNITLILTRHPFVVLSLLAELVLLLLVVYLQFAFILLGVGEIAHGSFSLTNLWQHLRISLRRLRFGSLVALVGYFVLVIPFADLVYRTPLLSKIQIPEFILDFLTRNNWLLTGLIVFYLVIIVLAIRCLLALPLMVYRYQRPRTALYNSWRMTRQGQWWPLVRSLLLTAFISAVLAGIFYGAMYLLQCGLDYLPKPAAYVAAVINLTLIQVGSEIITVWSGVAAVLIIRTPLDINDAFQEETIPSAPPSRKLIFGAAAGFMVIAAAAMVSNAFYLNSNGGRRPITVSHRGVAEENGVQNTIPAMKKTHRLHPDYVEMDLHETKDHQFVVMHDENLKALTGVSKRPSQLTLQEITRLTARENGHRAKVASFDSYLRAAEHLHQKLLIEIKTTPYDSPGMVTHFVHRYGKRVTRDHDRIHSLNYTVVKKVKHLDPQLDVMYIQPYNFTYPNTVADGYSMEYSTLTHDFIIQSHLQKKQVFAWTANDPEIMKQMMYDNADGIITDNLGQLNKAIVQYMSQRTYAARIKNFIMVVPSPVSTLEP